MICIMEIFQSTCKLKLSVFPFQKHKRLVDITLIKQIRQKCGKNDRVMRHVQHERAFPTFLLLQHLGWNAMQCRERVAEWLRRLTRKPKVRTAVGSNSTLDSLVAVCNSSPGQPEPCKGNLVAAAGSCGGLMVKHPWPLLEISLSDFRRLATLNIYTYLPTCTD